MSCTLSHRDELIGENTCEPFTTERFYQMIDVLNKEPLFQVYLEHCKPIKEAMRAMSASVNS